MRGRGVWVAMWASIAWRNSWGRIWTRGLNLPLERSSFGLNQTLMVPRYPKLKFCEECSAHKCFGCNTELKCEEAHCKWSTDAKVCVDK